MMRDNTQAYFRADTVTVTNKPMPYRTVTATFDIADTSYTTEFILLPTIETCIFGNVFMYAHEDTMPQPHRRPVLTLNPNATMKRSYIPSLTITHRAQSNTPFHGSMTIGFNFLRR